MNVVIVHGSADSPKDLEYKGHWMPWLKRKLELNGFNVETPLMPKSWTPDYSSYKEEFGDVHVDEKTILVGHSSGCSFLVRWLGDTNKKVRKLILVAPWKFPYGRGESYKSREKFYDFEIKSTVKSNVKEIIIFTADNEEEDGKKSARLFHKYLDGKIIELRGKGHYTLEDMGAREFPEILEEILKAPEQ